ncbi:ABC transporter substrate-binding protein [Methylobacterium nodulans]|uniref:NMT1/THI5 like domain protein n=1 Tax=Methylobacterium nodulans (strain LMG 21967 / CNCM I-2342 / ORS 2060) TaxID=460265 RepID=B8IA10_METNO|nr:ABC transporter substrate-binding protein [Methylobacterium nodulans]ACL57238.1 NMT1/THI5 like domain protein [Methylobacterium nodulans ORS 2060]
MRTITLAILSTALAIAGAPVSQAEEKPEKTEVHIGAASTGMTYLPLLVAKQRRFFEDEGITVTIAAFSGGSKALEALLGGSSDAVAGAYSNTLTMAAKGQKLVTFAAQVNCPAWIFGLAKKNFGKVSSIADLKGKRIGVSAPGSSTHMAVTYILHKAGLKPEDVSFIGVGQAAGAVAAIKAGQLDALIVNDPVATLLMDAGEIRPLAEMRTEEGNKQVFGADYPESSLYSTKAFIDKNPRTIQAITNAIVRAEQWIARATPEEVAASVPPEYMVDDKTLYAKAFQNSRRCISQTGQLSAEGARTVKEVLAAFEPSVAKAAINLEATYDNSFVQRAAEKRP